jgi:hypothetical protein
MMFILNDKYMFNNTLCYHDNVDDYDLFKLNVFPINDVIGLSVVFICPQRWNENLNL